MTHRRLSFILGTIGLALLGAGCNGGSSNPLTSSDATSLLPSPTLQQQQAQRPAPTGPLVISSSAFQDGQPIPEKYTCKGQDFSPPVSFSNAPLKAVSMALIMKDTDAAYDHWALYNIRPDASGVAEGDVPQGSTAQSTGGHLGYDGPCPPSGKPHHYVFTLYALDNAIDLQDGTPAADIEKAMEGHIVSQASLTGTFETPAAPAAPSTPTPTKK